MGGKIQTSFSSKKWKVQNLDNVRPQRGIIYDLPQSQHYEGDGVWHKIKDTIPYLSLDSQQNENCGSAGFHSNIWVMNSQNVLCKMYDLCWPKDTIQRLYH